MSQLVPCPVQGSCGARSHHRGSQQYAACLKRSAARTNAAAPQPATSLPRTARRREDETLAGYPICDIEDFYDDLGIDRGTARCFENSGTMLEDFPDEGVIVRLVSFDYPESLHESEAEARQLLDSWRIGKRLGDEGAPLVRVEGIAVVRDGENAYAAVAMQRVETSLPLSKDMVHCIADLHSIDTSTLSDDEREALRPRRVARFENDYDVQHTAGDLYERGMDTEQRVLTHGDPHINNFGETPGGRVVFIDLDDLCISSPAVDLSIFECEKADHLYLMEPDDEEGEQYMNDVEDLDVLDTYEARRQYNARSR